ncbi:MAG: hypothetical protein HOW97_27345, partial [Catenulispora sp.]|nr:hypothetical protein [Catenulispora sp.]
MISDVLTWLSCPHCATALTPAGATLHCEQGHTFDLARPGYLSLLTGPGTPTTADTPTMLASRAAFLTAGHYAPLADLLAELATAAHHHATDHIPATPTPPRPRKKTRPRSPYSPTPAWPTLEADHPGSPLGEDN